MKEWLINNADTLFWIGVNIVECIVCVFLVRIGLTLIVSVIGLIKCALEDLK